MKCEIFSENNTVSLQDYINEWLDEHDDIEIVNILQSTKPNGFVWVTIFYKTKNEVRSDKLEHLRLNLD